MHNPMNEPSAKFVDAKQLIETLVSKFARGEMILRAEGLHHRTVVQDGRPGGGINLF